MNSFVPEKSADEEVPQKEGVSQKFIGKKVGVVHHYNRKVGVVYHYKRKVRVVHHYNRKVSVS